MTKSELRRMPSRLGILTLTPVTRQATVGGVLKISDVVSIDNSRVKFIKLVSVNISVLLRSPTGRKAFLLLDSTLLVGRLRLLGKVDVTRGIDVRAVILSQSGAHLHLLIFGGLVLSRGSGSLALGGGSSSSCGLSGSGCLGSSNNRGGSSSMVAEVRNMASVMTSGLGMIILEMMAGELTVSRVVHLLNITIDPWDAEFVELVGSVVGVVLDTIAILINDIALEVHILGGNVDLINVVDETEVDSGASLDHSLVGDVAGGSLHLGLDLVTVDLLSERNGINIAFLVLVGGLLLGLLVVGVKDVLNLDGRNIVD